MVIVPFVVRDGIPFTSVTVTVGRNSAHFLNVVIDTGSAGSMFNVDILADSSIALDGTEIIDRVRGVGGQEHILYKWVDDVQIGGISVGRFQIQTGNVNYGWGIDGILGFDVLSALGVTIDLVQMAIVKA
jgi:hypothetical protein